MPNKTLSLSQDAYDIIMSYSGNKSEYVSSLIEMDSNNEKSSSPDYLENIKKELWKEREVLDLKIKQIQNELSKLREDEHRKIMKEEMEQRLKAFKEEHDEFNQAWKDGKISDDEYWAGVEERKVIKHKIINGTENN